MAMMAYLRRLLARFPRNPVAAPASNRFAGTVIRAGACEFLATTALGEVRGRLADPEAEPADGASITVQIPAACIRMDMTPPEENAFAGRVISCVAEGERFAVRFRTESGVELDVSSEEMPPECESDEMLYAWVFPEDVVGG